MSRSERRRLTAWVRRNRHRMDDATRTEAMGAVNSWFRATHAARQNIEALPECWEEWTLLTPAHVAAFPIRQASLAMAKSRLESLKARVCVAPDDQCVHGAYGNDCPTCRGFDA